MSTLRVLQCVACALAAIGMGVSAAHAEGRAGDKTVAEVCSMCHGPGLMGAPKIGNHDAWQSRLQAAGSVDALASSAAHGKRSMPPRGGHPELTDADLKAAIEYMLSQSGG